MSESRFLSRVWICSLLAGLGLIVNLPTSTSAQVVADPSIGTVVISNGTTFQITGGTVTGNRNLFHSFSRFDVPTGGVADFQNNPNTVNIFSRVTGGTPSQIDGIIRASGTADLFLMNPSGIIFGQNARLDVGGSFVATTANAIQFGDRGFFSASISEPPSQLLTIDPSALVFNAQLASPGKITVQGDGRGTRRTTNLIDTQDTLRVPENRTLALVGGDLSLEGATLKTVGGRIELGSLAPGNSVKLVSISKGWALDYTGIQNFQDVKLTQQATVDASGAGGGDIQVQGRQITLVGGSQIEASTLKSQSGDGLTVTASDSINLIGFATDSFHTGLFAQAYPGSTGAGGNILIQTKQLKLTGSQISASTYGSGQGGDIKIWSQSVLLQGAGQILAGTLGSGNSGNIVINASDEVSLIGVVLGEGASFTSSGLFARAESSTQGNSGNITVNTRKVLVQDGAQISTRSRGGGRAGDLTINAEGGFVELTGARPRTAIRSRLITAGFSSSERGGNININTGRFVVKDGAIVVTSTFGKGQAGDLTLNATESVELNGATNNNRSSLFAQTNSAGRAGDLTINTNQLSVQNGALISTSTGGKGQAGNLVINADRIRIAGISKDSAFRSAVAAETSGEGNAGNLVIQAEELSIEDGAVISTVTTGRGVGGEIRISAAILKLIGVASNGFRSAISSETEKIEDGGNAGNIKLNSGLINISDGAIISSSTFGKGQGGNIELHANTIELVNISENKQPQGEISGVTSATARSQGNGAAGNIRIRVDNRLNLNNSNITTSADASSGGAINITGGKIRLTGDSDISSSVASGINGGGDIRIAADYILALNDSDIFAFSKDGQGGNISLSRAYFGVGFQASSLRADPQTLQGNDRPDINATGQVSSGIVNTPDNSFIQNDLAQLSQNLIDPNALLANSCIVRNREQNGSFFVTGSGGLPVRPGDAPPSSFPTGEVRSLPHTQSQSNRPWQLGDVIVEPQGIYRLPNGKLVMSRECQTQ